MSEPVERTRRHPTDPLPNESIDLLQVEHRRKAVDINAASATRFSPATLPLLHGTRTEPKSMKFSVATPRPGPIRTEPLLSRHHAGCWAQWGQKVAAGNLSEQLGERSVSIGAPGGQPAFGGCDKAPGRTGVGEGGLEPPHPFGHRNLNPARLPIPPLARVGPTIVAGRRRASASPEYAQRLPMTTATRVQTQPQPPRCHRRAGGPR